MKIHHRRAVGLEMVRVCSCNGHDVTPSGPRGQDTGVSILEYQTIVSACTHSFDRV